MREIEFRGISELTGGLVYGWYRKCGDVQDCIFDQNNSSYVKAGTIEQYTGLKDKNGVKIFEGDIFKLDDDWFAPVVKVGACFCLDIHPESKLMSPIPISEGYHNTVTSKHEIIGNIHK